MPQIYSDPTRESDPHALPNVEVFFDRCEGDCGGTWANCLRPDGWYWWACFPGCLPDGQVGHPADANGPFETATEAIADAQEVQA